MENVLANPLVVAVVSGLGLAILGAIWRVALTRWRLRQLFSLYRTALESQRKSVDLSASELKVFSAALSDRKLRQDIISLTLGPEEEARGISQYVLSHATPDSRLQDPTFVRPLVGRWLVEENRIEGQFSAFHERARLRREEFRAAERVDRSSSTPALVNPELDLPLPTSSGQIGGSAELLTLVTPFTPLASIQGKAKQCRSRDATLHLLRANVDNATNGIVVIEGFGGIGKTCLASKLAADSSSESDVLWIDCQTQVVTVGKLLTGLAAHAANHYGYRWLGDIVGNADLSVEEKINGLVDFFAARTGEQPSVAPAAHRAPAFVLFFDDYHEVRDRALDHLISKVATSKISVKIVMLLRNRQGLSRELQTLIDTEDTFHLSGFTLAECTEFLRFYGNRYPAVSDLSPATVQRIWRRTGEGIPQALTIFIDLARRLPVDDLLRELPNYDRVDLEINKMWFDKVFTELSSSEREALTSVSVLRRAAPLALLESLYEAPDSDETIEALVDRFVLTFDGRLYSLHALWSDYARKLLRPDQAARAHLAAATYLRTATSEELFTFAYTIDQMECCYHYLRANRPDDASAALTPVADRLCGWGYSQEMIELVNELETQLASQGRAVDPELQIARCAALHQLGDVKNTIKLLEALIESTTGAVQVRAIHTLGWIYINSGVYGAASELFERSRRLCVSQRLPYLEAESLHGLNQISYLSGQYDKCIEWSEQRLTLLRSLGSEGEASQDMAWTFHDIGNVYREQGKYQEALPLYERDLAFWHKQGDPPFHIGWLRYDIGQIYYQLGEWSEAQSWYEKALDAFDKVRYVFGLGHVKIELGRNGVHTQLSKEEAVKNVLDGIEDEKRVDGLGGVAYGYHALGEIYLYVHEPEQAITHLEQSLKIEEDLKSQKGKARCLHCIALAHEQQAERMLVNQRIGEARTLGEQALREIQAAQPLYAGIGVAKDYRHIDEDAERIARLVARCSTGP